MKTSKSKIMIILTLIMFVALCIATPSLFYSIMNGEFKTRDQIRSVKQNLDVDNIQGELKQISRNERIIEIIAVDNNGSVKYTINNTLLFSDPNATVLYDSKTGLIEFSGERTSYFERSSILGALLNVGDDDLHDDDDDDDDDDDRPPLYDYRFVKDNTYRTIVLQAKGGGDTVYIICSQDYHVGFVVFLATSITLWSVFIIFLAATISIAVMTDAKKHGINHKMWGLIALFPLLGAAAYLIYKAILPTCPSCNHLENPLNAHCTKCGTSLKPKSCPSCGNRASKGDISCGKCGTSLSPAEEIINQEQDV